MLKQGDRVVLMGCSDPREPEERPIIQKTAEILAGMGLTPVIDEGMFRGGGQEEPMARAGALVRAMEDPQIAAVFDVSGGNRANGTLAYLDPRQLHSFRKPFFGYSDLTALLNPLAQAGAPAFLYQVKNLAHPAGEPRREEMQEFLLGRSDAIARVGVRFVQGREMEGRLMGGNLRCLLKLAGTPFWPDLAGKLLFLEALGGSAAFVDACFAQLRQMGALEAVAGVVLGTFTTLQGQGGDPVSIARRWLPPEKPLAVTDEVGHGEDSRLLALGRGYRATAADGLLAPVDEGSGEAL